MLAKERRFSVGLSEQSVETDMKSFSKTVFPVVLCLVGACVTDPGISEEPATPPLNATLSREDCPLPNGGGFLYWMDPPSIEFGESVTLDPMFTPSPWAFEHLPAGCVGELSVHPEGAVEFTRLEDGTPVATVTDQAENGGVITIRTVYAGEEPITATLSAYDPSTNPLVGIWEQIDYEDCPAGSRILELSFRADGTFSVTWTPFESYRDYWGSYDYEQETGLLTLEIDGGNHIPNDVAIQEVGFYEGNMYLKNDGSFGSNSAGNACDMGFEKR